MICNNADYFLLYEGRLNTTNVESMLDLVRTGVAERLSEVRVTKLSRVLIEVLQNIVKHAAFPSDHASTIMLFKSDKGLFLKSTNIVSDDDKSVLLEKYKTLQTHEQVEFRDLYRNALRKSEFNKRGGAGIGIYDIAYRTGSIPEYEFLETQDPGFFTYILTINLSNGMDQ